eukprot:SAG11_NODE_37045_length_257_cov_1.547170_1_plen_50_part_01
MHSEISGPCAIFVQNALPSGSAMITMLIDIALTGAPADGRDAAEILLGTL